MTHQYDEDLLANKFFISMSETCPELYTTAAANRWTICVPRTGAIVSITLTDMDFQNHVLLPTEGGETYKTVNGKQVSVVNGAIVTGIGFKEERTVPILFEETFFNEDQLSYRIICLSTLLEGETDDQVDETALRGSRPVPNSLTECRELLWGHDINRKTQRRLDEVVEAFNRSCDSLQGETIDSYIGAADAMFHDAVQKVYKDKVLKTIVDNDETFANKIDVAVEIYTMHNAYRKLFKGISSSLSTKDADLNKISRNLSHIQIQDLKIGAEFAERIPRARRELSGLVKFSTPMGKLYCIRRVVVALMQPPGYVPENRSPNNTRRYSMLTTDDLLPLLVFMIIKSQIANWFSHVCYMKQFRFSKYNNDDEFSYYLASFEAALEHLSSGQIQSEQPQFFNPGASAWATTSLLRSDRHDSGEDSRLEELFDVIRNGSVDSVGEIIDKFRVEHEEVASRLCHPLCSCDNCERLMLSSRNFNNNVTVYSRDDMGSTALHVAAAYGQLDVLEYLIKLGGPVTAANCNGSTPLHFACQRGHQSITLILLHYEADPGCADCDGNTPLHLCSTNGHDECVKALVYSDGSNVSVNVNAVNDQGDTALHMAARWGYISIIETLLENGASVRMRNKKKQTPINCSHSMKTAHLLLKMNERDSPVRFMGVPTPAEASTAVRITRGKAPAISAISDLSVSPPGNSVANSTNSHLDRLLRSIADGDVRMVRYHLGYSGESESDEEDDDSLRIPLFNQKLCHPLCQCSRCQPLQKPSQSAAGKKSAVINSPGPDGLNCLHASVLHGNGEIVNILLRNGGNIESRTRQDNATSLHLACQYKRTELVKMLIGYGARVSGRDARGNTPLHVCAMNGCVEAARSLLANEANVDAVNSAGDTPLHEAARWNTQPMVALLIKQGARRDIENKLTLTANKLAVADGLAELFNGYVGDLGDGKHS